MKSLDAAVWLLDKSIKRGQENHEYYMDFVKLHKLLYLAQCYLKYKYQMDLFEENIVTSDEGPYIEGLDLIPAYCGFSKIKNIPSKLWDCIVSLPPSFSRDEVLDIMLDMYGQYSTYEIVMLTRNTLAHEVCHDYNGKRNIIFREALEEQGKELFEDTTCEGYIDEVCCNEKCKIFPYCRSSKMKKLQK